MDMDFVFPPEKQSKRLVSAIEALKVKGYYFGSSKRMCQVKNENSGFIFEVKPNDRAFNQKNYEEIGEIITEFVFGLLESSPLGLRRREIPSKGENIKVLQLR